MKIPAELLQLQPLMLRAITKGELDARLNDWIDLPPEKIPERLSIYRISSMMTVLSALKKTFKATVMLLGTESFETLAKQFLREQRCTSADISEVGVGFSEYLKNKGWISDLAAFEWSWHQAFHGPNYSAPDMSRLQYAIAQHQESLPLRCTPGLVLLYSRYALPELWHAVMARHPVDDELECGDYYFAFSQQQGKVTVQGISKPMYQSLQCLQTPCSLMQWIERYQARSQQTFEPQWVAVLFESGLIQLGDA